MSVSASTMTPAARQLAGWAVSLGLADIPEPTLEVAREHLIDTLGCGLAALGVGEGLAGLNIAEQVGTAKGATAIGVQAPVSTTAAALANGMLCHALDFDDTHEASLCHIGTVVVPAALAVAQVMGASGGELLAAVVAGSEIVARIGMGATGGFHRRGFHPTGICGVFGAAAAACRLRHLDVDTTTQAFGLAGSMASGIFEYLADGSPTKPLHAGWASQGGVQAAALAAAGARGPETVLEGRFGVYATHVDMQPTIHAQLRDLGERWEVDRVALKPYPACHWTHAPVDAAVAATEGLRVSEIERLTVRIPDSGVPIVIDPLDAKRRPATAYDAKFSLPWCIAARLTLGQLDVRSFTDAHLRDPAILELADRIEHGRWHGEPAMSPFAGIVEVNTGSDMRVERCEAPRGSSQMPLSSNEVLAKFRTNASLALPVDVAADLIAAATNLGVGVSVDALTAPLARAASTLTAAKAGHEHTPARVSNLSPRGGQRSQWTERSDDGRISLAGGVRLPGEDLSSV